MKRILLLITIGTLSINQALAQLPKHLVGNSFYNTDLVNLNPRFGGVPRLHLTSTSTGDIQKGDVVELGTIKKYKKNGFIITTNHTKRSDTFEYVQIKKDCNVYSLKDQKGHLWVTKVSNLDAQSALKNYPQQKEDQKRWVINLPQLKNEENYKVEIYVGNLHDVDCNNYFLSGTVETKAVEGFGFHYYEVGTDNRIITTMKACPDNITYRKFIFMKPIMVNYNSKLPLVLYTPENLIVRYKVYSGTEDWGFAFPQ
ncbi:MAG TPA: ecotin family protein [Edaphocola sp.]|nr:ecotin family protein [Edaphocola sp.]